MPCESVSAHARTDAAGATGRGGRAGRARKTNAASPRTQSPTGIGQRLWLRATRRTIPRHTASPTPMAVATCGATLATVALPGPGPAGVGDDRAVGRRITVRRCCSGASPRCPSSRLRPWVGNGIAAAVEGRSLQARKDRANGAGASKNHPPRRHRATQRADARSHLLPPRTLPGCATADSRRRSAPALVQASSQRQFPGSDPCLAQCSMGDSRLPIGGGGHLPFTP